MTKNKESLRMLIEESEDTRKSLLVLMTLNESTKIVEGVLWNSNNVIHVKDVLSQIRDEGINPSLDPSETEVVCGAICRAFKNINFKNRTSTTNRARSVIKSLSDEITSDSDFKAIVLSQVDSVQMEEFKELCDEQDVVVKVAMWSIIRSVLIPMIPVKKKEIVVAENVEKVEEGKTCETIPPTVDNKDQVVGSTSFDGDKVKSTTSDNEPDELTKKMNELDDKLIKLIHSGASREEIDVVIGQKMSLIDSKVKPRSTEVTVTQKKESSQKEKSPQPKKGLDFGTIKRLLSDVGSMPETHRKDTVAKLVTNLNKWVSENPSILENVWNSATRAVNRSVYSNRIMEIANDIEGWYNCNYVDMAFAFKTVSDNTDMENLMTLAIAINIHNNIDKDTIVNSYRPHSRIDGRLSQEKVYLVVSLLIAIKEISTKHFVSFVVNNLVDDPDIMLVINSVYTEFKSKGLNRDAVEQMMNVPNINKITNMIKQYVKDQGEQQYYAPKSGGIVSAMYSALDAVFG